MKKIILASGSPRRSELLRQIGIEFEVLTPLCEEHAEGNGPEETAAALSAQKCMSVADGIIQGRTRPEMINPEGYIVIGSDTVVAIDGMILGKPKDEEDAFKMLKLLSGSIHTVYTGVTIFDTASSERSTFTEHTGVKMFSLTDEEIREYIATGEPMDKAGSYGIQGKGAVLVESIQGDYFTVVGLPIARLSRELKRFTDQRR